MRTTVALIAGVRLFITTVFLSLFPLKSCAEQKKKEKYIYIYIRTIGVEKKQPIKLTRNKYYYLLMWGERQAKFDLNSVLFSASFKPRDEIN